MTGFEELPSRPRNNKTVQGITGHPFFAACLHFSVCWVQFVFPSQFVRVGHRVGLKLKNPRRRSLFVASAAAGGCDDQRDEKRTKNAPESAHWMLDNIGGNQPQARNGRKGWMSGWLDLPALGIRC